MSSPASVGSRSDWATSSTLSPTWRQRSSVLIDGDLIYEEVGFSVAGAAVALTRRSQVPAEERPDFEYDSMSPEGPGILWLRRAGIGWRLGSIRQDRHAMRVLAGGELDGLVLELMMEVEQTVRDRFGDAVAETKRTAAYASA